MPTINTIYNISLLAFSIGAHFKQDAVAQKMDEGEEWIFVHLMSY